MEFFLVFPLFSCRFTEKELRELDLQAYLASSSSEDEDDEEEDNANGDSTALGGGRKRWKVTEENLQEYRRQLLGVGRMYTRNTWGDLGITYTHFAHVMFSGSVVRCQGLTDGRV